VLVSNGPGGPVLLYAAAFQLGLDMFGPGIDDLDALVLVENGIPGYQPSAMPFPPFNWGGGGADMLLYSVRRGSAVIGFPDSCLGLPIEEGDILVPPPGGPGAPPCVLIAAENLGLATLCSGFAGPFGADELDTLDVSPDCNANLIPDGLDITYGTLLDSDGDTVADPCDACPGVQRSPERRWRRGA